MKEQNWSYLAGLIDGEGCFAVWKYWNTERNYWQYSGRLTITNTNLNLMKWLVSHFGGGFLCKREATQDHKASWEWRPKGKANHSKIILAILPYLVIKHEQAQHLLSFFRLGYGEQEQREIIIQRMNLLNRKGSVETDTLNGDEPKIQSELTGDCESDPVETLDS